MGRTFYFNPLPFPVHVLAKPVGPLCNMNCDYCYYLEKSELYKKSKAYNMTEELLERFVSEYIACQTSPAIQFVWHGGEPLLCGINFYRKAIGLQRRYGRDRQVFNCIQTNGLLLNDEWCRFFKEHHFLVGISLDGPEKIHNHYRKNCAGKGTFQQVMRGVELLRKHGVEFNTLSVIHDYNVNYPLEIYHFFKAIGSHFMQFAPIVERLGTREDGLKLLTAADRPKDSKMDPCSVDPVKYGKFYIQIFDEWVQRDVGQYFIQLFDATLAGMVNEPPGVCLYAKTCGHALAMEHNGDVYACDHFVYPEFRRGNILQESFINMALSNEQQDFGNQKCTMLPNQCLECRFLHLCNGECPKNRIATTSAGEYGLNYLCSGLRLYFEHVYPYMEFMAEELRHQRPPTNVMKLFQSKPPVSAIIT